MAYIMNSDIEERLGTAAYIQLTDDDGTGSADTDKVDEARQGAEGEADSYLAKRYAVPINLSEYPEVQAVLVSFVLDLAEYRLHARRPPIPNDIASKRANAIAWLTRLAKGEILLPAVKPVTENPAGGITGEQSSNERIFTRDDLENL